MPITKKQFNVYVYPSDIKRFKKTTRKLGVSQAFLFKKALDMIESEKKRHNVVSNTHVKPRQTAQEDIRYVSKSGVMVREGGAE